MVGKALLAFTIHAQKRQVLGKRLHLLCTVCHTKVVVYQWLGSLFDSYGSTEPRRLWEVLDLLI